MQQQAKAAEQPNPAPTHGQWNCADALPQPQPHLVISRCHRGVCGASRSTRATLGDARHAARGPERRPTAARMPAAFVAVVTGLCTSLATAKAANGMKLAGSRLFQHALLYVIAEL